MPQFLKSELLWQLLGGFALGTAILLLWTGPSTGAHAAVHHLQSLIGVHR